MSMVFGRPCLLPRQSGKAHLPLDVGYLELLAADSPGVSDIDADGPIFFLQTT
jgi:hypothetical protein